MLFTNRCGWKTIAGSGKLQKEHQSSAQDDTSNDDDTSNTSVTNRTIIGERQSDALCRAIAGIPCDPDLLPPGAQCYLATSKVICLLCKEHTTIPTGVRGTSWKRQDFLILGEDRNSIFGLIIIPTVLAVNCNEELTVLAKALWPPLTIPENLQTAKAMALPPHPLGLQVMEVIDPDHPSYNPRVEVHAVWVQHIGRDRPVIVCRLTHRERSLEIKGLVDTGADVMLVSYIFWLREWNLQMPLGQITGVGGSSVCLQSASALIVSRPRRKPEVTCPFIVQRPITVWERDLLSQWGMRLEINF